ncbi:MAG: hypothetical protein IPM29_25640 [Planctomycetes bacterium]|nr:hypothetical protein [Planctomycetota bacterium]
MNPTRSRLPTWCRELTIIATLACALGAVARTQTPTLLIDLNELPRTEASSDPADPDVIGPFVYFHASSFATGRELFRSDLTAAGTRLVLDSVPGFRDGSSGPVHGWRGGIVFAAPDPVHGPQLWSGDGTPAGTAPLLAIAAVTQHVAIGALQPFGSRLLFVAETSVLGAEWWITDGTAAGTSLVADILPGSGSSMPLDAHVIGGRVVFSAWRTNNGREPWVTDGTPGGTRMLADIAPGSRSSDARVLADLGNRLLLQQSDPSAEGLWVTDGTPAGTTPIAAGLTLHSGTPAVVLGNRAFFAASDAAHGRELWSSDGTLAGTALVADLSPGTADSWLAPLGPVGGGLVLFDVGDPGRAGLWVTDGTAAGTQWIAPVRSARALYVPADCAELGGGVLVFRGDDGTSGREPWRSDGTAAGTWKLRDLDATALGSDPAHFVRMGTRVAFAATTEAFGRELWSSDGTAGGTSLVTNLHTLPPEATCGGALIGTAVDWNGRAVFTGHSGSRFEVVVSGGTPDSTGVYHAFPGIDPVGPFGYLLEDQRTHVVAGRLLTITTDDLGNDQLWLDAGTGPVPGPFIQLATGYARLQGHAMAGDVAWLYGAELWHVRGLQVTRAPLPSPAPPLERIVRVGTAVLCAVDNGATADLWRCDAGPTCALLSQGAGGGIGEILAGRGRAWFLRYGDPRYGSEPWVTDGTAANTGVIDLVPGPQDGNPRLLTAVGAGLLLQADDGAGGRPLWLSDGTVAGTVRLDVFPPGSPDVEVDFAVGLGPDRTALLAYDDLHGQELWLLTPSGARLIADLVPGPESPGIDVLGTAGEELWFTTQQPEPGLWRSDGSAQGTTRVTELRAEPHLFVVAGGLVYLEHDDGVHGGEPWVVPAGATAMPIGSGCGDALRTPYLESNDPVLGRTLTLRGGSGPLGSVGVLLVGAPLVIPNVRAGGCVDYVDLASAAPLAFLPDAAHDWRTSIPLPNDTALVGLQLVAQCFVAPTPNASGLETSPGLWLSLDTR